jgi:uncharacterized membrane protein
MENTNKTLMIVLIVVLVLLLFGNIGYGMGGFGGGMMGGLYGGFMLLGWIFNLIIFVLIILGVYWLVRHISYDGKNVKYNGRKIK